METLITINNKNEFIKKFDFDKVSCEELQGLVGGLIDYSSASRLFESKNIDLIVRDEIDIENPDNLTAVILDKSDKMIGGLFGPIIFAGYDGQGGNIGLDEKQQAFVLKQLKTRAVLTNKITGEPKSVFVIRYE